MAYLCIATFRRYDDSYSAHGFSMTLIPFCQIQFHLFEKGDVSMRICLRVDMVKLFTFDFSGRVW